MKISQLYTYPVKSLRETPISEAEVSRHGFLYDRRFMLLKVHTDDSPSGCRLKNMHVADFPALTRFLTNIKFPEDDDDVGELYINWSKPGSDDVKSLTVPLRPDTSGLELIEITMHSSPTKAYDMGSKYNDWFSSCLGYDVVFAYLGPYLRKVLMSTRPIRQPKSNGGWLSSITSTILGSANDEEQVTFADGAAYLVVSETSLQDVSSRLPEGQEMDITKFRPNIVVTEADKIWDEDFWHEIQIGDIKITLAQNCGRCKSINIDYATGAPGKDQTGRILAKLQKDRRIDKGAKYSPVFGRYGFLVSGGEGKRIAVGDEVTVTKRGTEYTKFDWPGVAIEA
ncbi:Mitochondrial amidoxime-reducing component 1 [Daldinia childiae]|uniref:Mitochondrial amidoxime-reducing component 1 n=1 Tax=Daldinia childiae TaxID=326645 RepID=UPI00144565B7|nr:Mitochondrial amidoxime-reducing component 1 [Daldinia childiae]KAF3062063.1 Mitochondrial amidoxime-reducing component 1 [Daldinia childiae]